MHLHRDCRFFLGIGKNFSGSRSCRQLARSVREMVGQFNPKNPNRRAWRQAHIKTSGWCA